MDHFSLLAVTWSTWPSEAWTVPVYKDTNIARLHLKPDLPINEKKIMEARVASIIKKNEKKNHPILLSFLLFAHVVSNICFCFLALGSRTHLCTGLGAAYQCAHFHR